MMTSTSNSARTAYIVSCHFAVTWCIVELDGSIVIQPQLRKSSNGRRQKRIVMRQSLLCYRVRKPKAMIFRDGVSSPGRFWFENQSQRGETSKASGYTYDWNMLPIGQMIALRHLETFEKYPPMQAAPSYNLAQVMAQIQAQKRSIHNSGHPSD